MGLRQMLRCSHLSIAAQHYQELGLTLQIGIQDGLTIGLEVPNFLRLLLEALWTKEIPILAQSAQLF
jgi:hypothetical protein